MGKYFETSAIFNYSWEQLAKAFWKRYPNPNSSHVLTEDTIFREIRGNELYTKRLITKTNRMPKWGEKFVPSSVKQRETQVLEESVVNPDTQTVTTYTRNIGFTKIMTVVEKVVYSPNPEDPSGKTVAYREAWIDSSLYGFRRAIESFGLNRFQKNSHQAAEGFNWVLQRLYGPPISGQEKKSVPAEGSMKEKAKQRFRELAKRKPAMGTVIVHAAPSTDPSSDSKTPS